MAGPGGLYFSILMRKVRPDWEVTVFERNAPERRVRVRGGVLRRDADRVRARRPRDLLADRRAVRALDRHRHPLPGDGDALGRARVRRARPARAAAGSCRSGRSELGADIRFCVPRRRRCPSWAGPIWSSARTARRARCGGAVAGVRAVARPAAVPYMWLGTDLRVRRVQVLHRRDARRRVPGARVSLRRPDEHVHRRDARAVWQRAGLDRLAPGPLPPGVSDAASIERCAELFADALEGHAAGRQQLEVDRLRHGPQPALVHRQRGAARRRRAHRALLDRVGDEARDGGRGGAGVGVSRVRRRRRPRAMAAYEAERRPIVESTQRAAQASLEWFEGIGRYVEPGAAAVRVQPADAQPARDLRQPAAARPRRSSRRCTRIRGRRCSCRSRCAGWSCPTASWCRRWTCTRRSTGPRATSTSCTWAPRARRRGAADDRDDLRVGRGADHARAARGCGATSTSAAWKRIVSFRA